jgi:septum formation protein
VLASASPRRRVLLAALGIHAEVCPADIDEAASGEGLAPGDAAVAIAVAKAQAVIYDGRPILAADTIVIAGETILGKPDDRGHARSILRLMSGTRVAIVSGLALRLDADTIATRRSRTVVQIDALNETEIAHYLGTGEADDKAGGLAIQGSASSFARIVEGSRSNTFGLPLAETADLLRLAGFEPARTAPAWNEPGP